MDHERILVINVAGIGDFVESIPAIKALRLHFPESYIALLVASRVFPYASQSPCVDDVYNFPLIPGRKSRLLNLFGNIEICRLLNRLKKKKFDTIINLKDIDTWKGSLRMAALFFYIGAKNRLGRDLEGKGFFLNLKVPEKIKDKKSQADYYEKVVNLVGVKVRDRRPEIWISEEEKKFAEGFMKQNNVVGSDLLVGINPGSDRLTRRWHNERWADLADRIIRKHNSKIMIIGGAKDVELSDDIKSKMHMKPIVASGKTEIGQLIALIGKCNVLISTNSAAMHIAGVLGVPVVGLIGPGSEFKDRPYGRENNMVLIKIDVGCNPCYKWDCEDMICMKEIKVEEVYEAVEKLLGEDNIKVK